MRGTLALVLVAALATTALAGTAERPAAPGELSGTITLSGAWALYPMAIRWAEEFEKLHPAVKIDVAAGGAGKGMTDALAGIVDIGMISREIYEAEVERGAWWVSVTRDAVVPVINESNPRAAALFGHGAGRETLAGIWLSGGIASWGNVLGDDDGAPVHVYTRSDACGAAQTWAAYLGGTQEELLGIAIYGDPGLAEAVRRDALGIGFNNINYVYDVETGAPLSGLRVLPIDLNDDGGIDEDESFYDSRDRLVEAIAKGIYPSPPARDLHFASKGAPSRPVVREFMRWVLTDGQKFVAEAGYVRLSDEKLAAELAKLE